MQDEKTAIPERTTNARDIATGGLLIALAGAGLYLNQEYELGTSAQMGPGYMPMLVFVALIALGVALVVTGLRTGPGPLERWAPRELGLVLAAMAVFGALLEKAGLAVSIVLLVVISGLADRSQTPLGIAGLAVVLVALCWAIFILGLGLNVPFLPPMLAQG